MGNIFSNSKKNLWKVPLYCIIAGRVSFYLIAYVFKDFIIRTYPDGSIAHNNTGLFMVYGGVFVVTVLIGGMIFFRKMTRKEIFFSATIIVVFQMIISLMQLLMGGSVGLARLLGINPMSLSRLYDWSGVVYQIILKMRVNAWLAIFIQSLMPYLFIVFGQRSSSNDVAN